MQATQPLGINRALPAMRLGARILSALILLFWGFMLIAHVFGEEAGPSRPLVWQDSAILATLLVSLAGLAVAWKWELLGGALTLAAMSACAFFNWQVLMFPGTLIPVAALMFLACGWMSRAPRYEPAARPQ